MTSKPVDDDAHARLSPSAAHRWMVCPGSIELSGQAPADPSSEYADEGTMLHEWSAEILRPLERGEPVSLQSLTRSAWQGTSRRGGARTFEVTEEHAECVHTYVSAVIDEVVRGDIVLIERRMRGLTHLHKDLWGTGDAIILSPARSTIKTIDAKFGAGYDVSAAENPQLAIYMLAALVDYQMIAPFGTLEGIIVQPRTSDEPKRWSITVDAARDWLRRILEAARYVDGEGKNVLVDGDHCRFCPARAICPQLESRALTVARAEFDDIERVPVMQLAEAMLMVPRVEAWIRAIEAEANRRLSNGEDVPGFKLVEGRGSRKWYDEARTRDWASSRFANEAYTEPKLLSVAQMEQVAKRFGMKIPDSLIEKVPGKPKVAPASDKRVAQTRAAIEFNDDTYEI